MSHFYGSAQGNRGEVTRGGSKGSGFETYAASWEGAVQVFAWYHETLKEDWVTISLTTWHGAGSNIELYRGPISGKDAHNYISLLSVKG